MDTVSSRVRGILFAVVVILAAPTVWAMQPGGAPPSTQPAARPDIQKIGAALRQAPANYARWKLANPTAQPKQTINPGNLPTASRITAVMTNPASIAAASQPSSPASLAAARPDLEIRLDRKTGAAVFIKGRDLHHGLRAQALSGAGNAAADVGQSPDAAATADGLDTLQEYRGLLKIADAPQEFHQKQIDTDALGLTHVKYQQVYKGLPVWNKQLWVHLDSQGAAYLVEGRATPTPVVATQPQITAQQAIDRATTDLGAAENPSAELIVYVDSWDIAHLAWHVTATAKLERWHYFIDALQGVILHKASDTRYEATAGTGVDLFNRTDTFSAWHQGNAYYLLDTSMPEHASDPNLPNALGAGNLVVFDGQHQDPNNNVTAYFLESASPATGWDQAGVSVMNSFRIITDYYKNTHNRNGIDNQTLNTIGFVHVGTAWDNAAWTGQVIFIGDGGTTFLSLARGLDVLAHEYTHGVIEYSANFEYQFQSGALHEALADVFACMVDRSNWTIGEDVVKGVLPLRNLQDPHAAMDSSPATMDEYQSLPLSQDLGGVHVNATIVGHAAYLMAEGLPSAIGRDKVEKVFYRALTLHMTAQSDFSDCRSATIQSAQELYGAATPEVQGVTDAWDAVKITATSTGGGGSSGGGQISPVQGPDALVFVTHDASGNAWLAVSGAAGGAYSIISQQPLGKTWPTRSVITVGGTAVFYVDSTNNLRMASLHPQDNYDEPVTFDGSIRSIGGSKDGRYFAFTDTPINGVFDSKLYVLDLNTSGNDKTFDLYWPSADGGQTTSLLDHADVIDFDISNKHIVFDAMNSFTLPGGQQNYTYWSVGILDVSTGQITAAVPAQPPGIQVGNPSASSTRDWIIAVDIVDDNAGTCQTRVVNLQTNKTGLVAEQNNTTDNGWPSFNGDDSLLALQYGGAVVQVPVAADSDGTVQGDFSKEQTLETSAWYPRYYRTGQVGGKPKISLSTTAIDYGDVTVSTSVQATLTIGNTGDYPLNVSGYTLSDTAQFAQDGTPVQIAAGYELDVNITFTPAAAGAQSAVLTIASDDPDTSQASVQLTGQAVDASSGNGGNNGGGNSSRRCFIATAAYGSYLEPHVMALRAFRDQHLLTNTPGRAFVAAYYRVSPPIAAVIARRESLRAATRAVLTPIVLAVQYPAPALVCFLGLSGSAVVVWRRLRISRRRTSPQR